MRGGLASPPGERQEAMQEGTGRHCFPDLGHPLCNLYPLDFRMSL